MNLTEREKTQGGSNQKNERMELDKCFEKLTDVEKRQVIDWTKSLLSAREQASSHPDSAD